MRTLIYGAGPIGRWMALLLSSGGADVTMLARGATLELLREHGVVVYDAFSGERRVARVPIVSSVLPEDDYQLVIVPMRKSARAEILPILGRTTGLGNVLLVGNDVTGTRDGLTHLPPDRLLLGFATCGGGLDGDRMVVADRGKQGGGLRPFHLGAIDDAAVEPAGRVARFLRDAGVPTRLEADMDGWLKYHFAFIGPVAGLILAAGGDLMAVARDAVALRRFQRACRQAGDVLAATGHTRRQPPIFNLFYWSPELLAPWMFRPLFESPFAQVAFGLHMGAIGSELWELRQEFATLQGEAGLTTPELDQLLEHIPR